MRLHRLFSMCKIKFLFRANDDIEDYSEVKQFVENISAVRQSKINKILDSVQAETLTLKLNSICAKELEQIRLFLNEAFTIKLDSLTTDFAGEVIYNDEIDANNFFNSGGFI